jgi:glutathione S-transferase
MYWATVESDDAGVWTERLTALNSHLTLRSYLVGHALTIGDAAVFHALAATAAATLLDSNAAKQWPHLIVC